MSFDLFLEHFEAGESAQAAKTRVLSTLRKIHPAPADQFGFYLIRFPGGSSIEFSAKGLEEEEDFSGCAFHLRGFSKEVFKFIFDIAKAGDMVIFNAQGRDSASSPLAILTNEKQRAEMPERVASQPVLCESADHLGALLGVDFLEWSDYRDQVRGDQTE